MNRPRSKRVLAAVGIMVLVLFLVRPGAQWLKSRIVTSISSAIGRPVDTSSVSLRFLPQPGFELDNFVVYDSPEFSAEPMMRASDVTASLRLSSLLRGRLEISKLSLDNPSLNLVRNNSGHWNLENLLQRAAQIPVAPTKKARGEPRPAFPYIEANDGRINFKLGEEKKSFALTSADFGLWQDSENSWSMRLQATPLRTDFNLTNTGILYISGTWSRSTDLHETPLQFRAYWDSGQLGEATKLISGTDKGWRGGLSFSADLKGTPVDLAVKASATVQDFHRYDNWNGQMVRLAAQCGAHYSSQQQSFSGLSCRAPVGEGIVLVTGGIGKITAPREYQLQAALHNVPAQSVLALVRSLQQSIPEQLQASGLIDSHLLLSRKASGEVDWQGSGGISNLRLSGLPDANVNLAHVPLAISMARPTKETKLPGSALQATPSIEIGPANIALGRAKPAAISAWVSRSGYGLELRGDAQVQPLLRLAQAVGMGMPQTNAEGHAKVDLQIVGTWADLKLPRALGTAQLREVQLEMRGVNAPLNIISANLALEPQEIEVRNIVATLAASKWHGSLLLPRPCIATADCPFHFDLRVDELDAAEFYHLLAPHTQKPWYSFFTSQAPSVLAAMRASGKLLATKVSAHGIAGNKFSGDVEMNAGEIYLRNVRGYVLGGHYAGDWTAQLIAKPLNVHSSGVLDHIDLSQLATALHGDWATGTATAKYQISASGISAAQALSSAVSELQIKAVDGLLPHMSLAMPGPVRLRRFDGNLSYHGGNFILQNGKLGTPTGMYAVSGTATFANGLDLKLVRERNTGFTITGTLGNPHIAETQAPPTRVALKQ